MKTIIFTLSYILLFPLILIKAIAVILALLNEWSNKMGGKIMLKNLFQNTLRNGH